MSERPLSEKQKRFCKLYIACKFNGTQAAIKAGYSKKAAAEIASQSLRKSNIQLYISELLKKDDKKKGIEITIERVKEEIARLSFADIRKCYNEDGTLKPINELDDDVAATIAGIEEEEVHEWVEGVKKTIGVLKKIKRYDKTKPLEMLAKHFKLYTDAPVQNNTVTPFSDNQVDKIISALRSRK